MRLLFLPCIIVAALAAPGSGAPAQDAKPAPSSGPPPAIETLRDPEVVRIFSAMPVQANGRVKPLDTVARLPLLLRMHGKQSLKAATLEEKTGEQVPVTDPVTDKPLVDAKGRPLKLSAVEWLLITWFRPETAKALPVFIVDNSDIVELLGLHGKGKRDRYAYNEIVGGRETLMDKMSAIRNMKEADRSIEDRALGKLAIDFLDYEMMLGHLDFARAPFGDEIKSVPPELAVHVKNGNTDWAALLPGIVDYMKAHPEAAAPMANPWLRGLYRSMFGARMSGEPDTVLRIFPPGEPGVEKWQGPGTVIQEALSGEKPTAADYANLARYAGLVSAGANPAEFKAKAKAFVDESTRAAAERGAARHLSLEMHFHRADYFTYALICFILGIMFVAASWVFVAMKEARAGMRTPAKITLGLSWAAALAGMVLGITGIVIRCIIMGRPPITTLYETIVFIATTCVIFGLVAEVLTRRTFALIVANIAGMIGMFLSIRFLDMEAKDTLQQLQAVLITNFWLATHVPCINLGYTAGMMACLFSMLYLGLRMVGAVRAGDSSARVLGGVAYAFVLLGLFLSLVGTVLGGIWANYSWGRFWGWDPKENGALMIVLMNLVILHARLGNYIREVGFHTANVLLGMITLFSWFATNQLGIGLHAYGELSGAWKWLYITWTFMTAFIVFGIVLAQIDKVARRRHRHGHSAPIPSVPEMGNA